MFGIFTLWKKLKSVQEDSAFKREMADKPYWSLSRIFINSILSFMVREWKTLLVSVIAICGIVAAFFH